MQEQLQEQFPFQIEMRNGSSGFGNLQSWFTKSPSYFTQDLNLLLNEAFLKLY